MWGLPPGERVHKARRLPAAEYKSILERRQVLREQFPDREEKYIPTCGFCGLRWHQETNPDGSIGCDLKARRLNESYIGCALADAI